MPVRFLLWQRESWWSFWRQRATATPLALATVLLLISWLEVAFAPQPLENTFVLRYSIYLGVNWLTDPGWLWLLPSLSTGMVLVNVVMSYTIGRAGLLLKYVWLWSAVAVAAGWWWLIWLLVRFNT